MLKVYNTLTRKKEKFVPRKKGKVGMYVCGPTVYDYCHLGHARCYVAFDVIRKYLEYSKYKVKYVQNFTDVDDKIINRARELKENPLELAQKFTDEYIKDMQDGLGVEKADVHPKVSEHIADIIKIVQTLVKKGFAYEVDGDVYYEVSKFKEYGKLSRQALKDIQAGARVGVDKRKKHPEDFALWKKAKAGEISWKSPWGKGRPGWHIECSAMSSKYLGTQFDIHGGGRDLIFPHHENEIAQSEAASGKSPFSKYWIHNGFVTIDKEKMSKSLGNFFTIRDILKKYDPEVVRYFLISTHYRSPIDFSDEHLDGAKASLERLHNTYSLVEGAIPKAGPGDKKFADEVKSAKQDFKKAMDDDFNTTVALACVFDFVRKLNKYLADKPDKSTLKKALKFLDEIDLIFGVLKKEDDMDELVPKLLDLMVQIREDARKRKDFEVSDKIRDELLKVGVQLEDQKDGVRWKRV